MLPGEINKAELVHKRLELDYKKKMQLAFARFVDDFHQELKCPDLSIGKTSVM